MKKLLLSLTLLLSAVAIVSPVCAALESPLSGPEWEHKRKQLIELRLRIARAQLQQAKEEKQLQQAKEKKQNGTIQEYQDEIRRLKALQQKQ